MQGSVTHGLSEKESAGTDLSTVFAEPVERLLDLRALSERTRGRKRLCGVHDGRKLPRFRGVGRLLAKKAWITNGAIATLLVMYAQTEPGSGGNGIASSSSSTLRRAWDRQVAALPADRRGSDRRKRDSP